MQIDPKQVTNFGRTDAELQAFWLFSGCMSGKNADYAASCLARLLHKCQTTPFEYLSQLGEIGVHNALVASKIGQYGRLTKFIMQSLDLDLRTASLEELMKVFGAGPKTCRFFLLHSRPNCECAVLDCHILKWLKEQGVSNCPAQTPTNLNLYGMLERMFLSLAKAKFPFMSIADIDLTLWMKYSGRLENDLTEPLLSSYSPFEDPQEEHESFA